MAQDTKRSNWKKYKTSNLNLKKQLPKETKKSFGATVAKG
jgi:hypothetical protein